MILGILRLMLLLALVRVFIMFTLTIMRTKMTTIVLMAVWKIIFRPNRLDRKEI